MIIAIAQLNPIVGDLSGNIAKILAAAEQACARNADLLVTSELAITGYPPRDLCDRPAFIRDSQRALKSLVEKAPLPMVVGGIVSPEGDPTTLKARFSNGAVFIEDNQIRACHRKQLLPNYDIFDEPRYFVPGTGPTLVDFCGHKMAITICEDIWNDKDETADSHYSVDPIEQAVEAKATLLLNLSASPYHRNKPAERQGRVEGIARRFKIPVIYVNQVGGNDALIFDGRSMAVSAGGTLAQRGSSSLAEVRCVEVTGNKILGEIDNDAVSWQEDTTRALCLGLSDYLEKTGFKQVVIGLSGGIDSALTAAIAVRALGKARVIGVAMPSRYSSPGSKEDAYALAANLDIRCDTVPIESMVHAFEKALAPAFKGRVADVTEENLQARVRGTLLMAYVNKLGGLLLTTGNKSELAVGYCTLYGDMNGGLGLLSDLYKTEVYALAHHINAHAGQILIPQATLDKPPSAELRPGQKDDDNLPPYDILDRILRGYIDEHKSIADLGAEGLDTSVVRKIAGLVATSEYKRRQMAQGLKVSKKAFGEGRRLPVAQKYGF